MHDDAVSPAVDPDEPPVGSHRAPGLPPAWRLPTVAAVLLAAVSITWAATVEWSAKPSPQAVGPGATGGPPVDGYEPGTGHPATGASSAVPSGSPSGPPQSQRPPTGSTNPGTQPASGPGTTTAAGPPPAGPVVPAAGVLVQLVNGQSGRAAGVLGGATANGAKIVQTAGSGEAEQWRIAEAGSGCFQFVNVHSGLALDNPNTGNGATMQQWAYAVGNVNQSWCFSPAGSGTYAIQNRASNMLLSIPSGSGAEGAAVQQLNGDPSAPKANQIWKLTRVG